MLKVIPIIIAGLLLGQGLMTGCAAVRPWEREYLADEIIQFEPDQLEASWDQHVHEVLEGSRGGFSDSGGGCGCR